MSKSFRYLIALSLLLILFVITGRWRATAVGPQVQVPMFYDDHYVYARPWTQAQAAPGIPAPAPLSLLYGANHLSQTFVAGADRLHMVEIWLAGPATTPVTVTLAGTNGVAYSGQITLDEVAGRFYRLTFPTIAAARGQSFTLTMAAPAATRDRPVSTRAVGGDRLGAAIRLNEYSLPGNLELRTYSQGGLPGRWWSQAIRTQILPDIFQLRLQQYKPAAFKGQLFTQLLLLLALLTVVFLALAWPGRDRFIRSVVWLGNCLLLLFLSWQLGSGRLQLLNNAVAMAPVTAPLPLAMADQPLLTHDFALTLWTAQRRPEERFVTTEFFTEAAQDDIPIGVIRVPAESSLTYNLTIPPSARFSVGLRPAENGRLRFRVLLGGVELFNEVLEGNDRTLWLDLPLAEFAGQSSEIRLISEPVAGSSVANPDGLWLQPQLQSEKNWLLTELPAAATPVAYRFEPEVMLVGYQLEPAQPRPGELVEVTLFWRVQRPTAAAATAFVHLLNQAGQIAAQHDAGPVQNSYPITLWQPGQIIADAHPLIWPADAGQTLIVGLYDPTTFVRWLLTDEQGVPVPENQARLATFE